MEDSKINKDSYGKYSSLVFNFNSKVKIKVMFYSFKEDLIYNNEYEGNLSIN